MNTLIKLTKVIYFLTFVSTITIVPLSAAERPSDEMIAHRIHNALFEDPRVRAADIAVKSIEGIVTLEGEVRTLAELDYADLETKKIKGVLGVINKLTVKPAYRLDAEIRQDIRRKIVNSSFIKSENLGVRAENGIVFLSGVVGSSAEKDQVYLLAEEVRGVKAIENHIEVTYSAKMPDAEIRKNVIAKISRDVYLVGLPISVTVKNGFVTLSGETGNVYEKDRAEKDAVNLFNVSGVKNDLKVILSKAGGGRNNPPALSDSALIIVIADELAFDSRINNPRDIGIGARHGRIILTGTVPTYFQKRLAERDAREIVGEESVDNLIQVKGIWRSDEGIYIDIRDALASDYSLIGDKINYYVVDGIVTLKGTVNSDYVKSRFEKDIEGIIGVKDIKDYIIVDWLPLYSDDALKGRIFDRLASNWETWQLLNKIIINVKEGKATLTGTVDTRAQFKEAGRITGQTDGIRSVDNQLVVHGS